MKRFFVVLAALALLLGEAEPAKAGVLYSQPTDLNGAYASQNDTNSGGLGNFVTAYDNFTLGSAATVTSVQWTGSYFGPPSQGPITAFTVNIYSDNGGIPGGVLNSTVISGNANETAIGGSGVDNAGDPTFTYSATLTTPFSAAAGTQYWLSVVPDLGFPPQWGWETSSGSGDPGDGAAYQVFFGSGSSVSGDLAFDLSSAPEPASLTLLGFGSFILAGYGWRRRKATARTTA